MPKSGILDAVPESRRVTLMHKEDDSWFIESKQDVTEIVEAAKAMSEQAPGKDFRHAAYIPEAILNQAFVEGWYHDKAAWKRWANDPENAKYRTWGGRL